MKLLSVIIIIVFFAFVFIWFLAGFKSARFNNSCDYLVALIDQSSDDSDSYSQIISEYDQLDAISEEDRIRKKRVWSFIQRKFKKSSPHTIK